MKRFALVIVLLSISSFLLAQNPPGWYAGDMHVHRSCGLAPVSVSSIHTLMNDQDLAALSLLADMGNGEVQDPATDLPLVNGLDSEVSTSGRIVHWDAEWHWDATYTQYPHQALGGHIVALGLSEAHQMWDESTDTILQWAHAQNAVAGFAHMQYLGSGFPQSLTCCTPVEYPVEVALGAADFISEDVDVGNGDSAVAAYYRLLNSGFRPGFAAGTDYPCNDGVTIGSPLTYARVANGQMTYRNWIDAISSGKTVVSRNGHNEFLSLVVNDSAGPGDQVDLATAGSVQATVTWTASNNLNGTIELIVNGAVLTSKVTSVSSGSPATLSAAVNFPKSGWVAARRMDSNGYVVHTAAVFVIVNGSPIRVNTADPQFYVQWMNNLLTNTNPGGIWNSYFPTSLSATQARYQSAKALYQQIAAEAQGTAPTLNSITVSPGNATISSGATQQFIATGNYSGGPSLNITGQVVWGSSNTSVVNISTRGLAAAVANGNAGISATLGSVTGSTLLTVQSPPLVITTQSLPVGIVNTAYSANLAAGGGTSPYTWTVESGSLPTGLSLNNAGGISGTPTAVGTFSFTAQAKDSGSPQQTAHKILNITIATTPAYFTIWSPTTVPRIADSGPDSAVELGVKFKSDTDGYISGVRFYKGTGNTGTHVGNLWTAGGTLLATVTFTNETTSGWQQASFSNPVAIQANTVYVASYHTTTGHYSDDLDYFATKGTDNPPLHALQDGAGDANGVFVYGSGTAFPNLSWRSSNYWVDVVYVPAGPDTTPPTVSSVSPSGGASGVEISEPVNATFNEALDPTTISNAGFMLLDASNASVPATVTYDSGSNTATLTPTSFLLNSTTYSAVVKGGIVKDRAGNALASDYTWSFTTAAPAPPPPNEGPGGPILVVSSSSNPFSRYYTEILRAEGLNEFTAMDISLVSSTTLSDYDLVVLGDIPLGDSQVTMFSDWVNAGGNLIALHPDKKLADILGLSDTGTTLAESYLKINVTTGPGFGLVGQTIQFHGSAERYALNGATSLATLYSSAASATANPAVTLNQVGLGQAAAFTYDLARSVVYTRQGNPAWSGQARDGQSGPIRSDDLFYGDAAFDPQPDWVDLSKVAIPQADEQQRLLANLILHMNQTKRPLPRFWYFPKSYKAVVVMTGDDHGGMYGGGATAGRFDQYIASSSAGCSVTDWKCVRATAYIVAPSIASNPLTNAQAQSYIAQGFEIGVHVDSVPDCSNWTSSELDSFYASQISSFTQRYTSVPLQKTHRIHCISWSDYDSQPKTELQHGIRLDTNYYFWPPEWVNDVPGVFTGSGMPMRFADRNGTLIDVYQATTQMTDESGQSYPSNIDTLLDNALGSTGYYGFFTANMHNDSEYSTGADQIIASAQARGVPIISARQLLTWLDGRNGSSFKSIAWNGSTLTFSISIAAGANGLQAMLPANTYSAGLTSITLNGSPVAFTRQTIKGVSYAVFSAAAGTYEANYLGTSQVAVSSVAMSPSSVVGGASSTGTVTLNGPAPAAGAEVALTTSDPFATTLPQSSVVVLAGATTATFTVNTSSVTALTNVTISASYGGDTVSAGLAVTPATTLASLALSPTTVVGSRTSTATVTLNQAAASGGVVVKLVSDNPAVATVPEAVTVSSGSTAATFTASTLPVSVSTPVAITATYGTSKSATLTINPPTPSLMAVNPATVVGGNDSTATVTLSGPAPTGGASVSLTSSNTNAATVPSSVMVNAGATTATFAVSTTAVTTSTTSTISASYGGSSATVTLTVTAAAALSTLTLNPTTVVGGRTSTGTVTLTQAAPTGGAVVILSSADSAIATVPADVTIPAGGTTATFTVNSFAVGVSTPIAITATYKSSQTATLTVTPPTPSTLALNPTSVIGGNISTATVTLSGPAPPGGASVTLTSSNVAAAPVPASVVVSAGASTATFTISTTAVLASTTATITVSYGGSSASATLSITPATALSTFTLNPTTVVGSRTSTGTVTLTLAAPTGGAVVNLSSANATVATVPASVTVAAGTLTTTFTINTSPVLTQTRVVITASRGGINRTATLIINPPALSLLALSPPSLAGGNTSTGTVTLNAPAPNGGVVVALTSSRTGVATVPTTIPVAGGATTATFTINTFPVSSSTSSVISAIFGSVTRTATLSVRAATPSLLTLNPSTVKGGGTSIGTVTLTGPAPLGGVVVSLSSGNNASVPPSVTVLSGTTTATFPITTRAVTSVKKLNISATCNGVKKTAALTITP